MFFSVSYKDERFYWEIVLSLRKIIIVGLGVFGPSLGPVSQSLVALLVLFIFIVLEILGDPFKEPTARHKILAKLELSTLMVLFWFEVGETMALPTFVPVGTLVADQLNEVGET